MAGVKSTTDAYVAEGQHRRGRLPDADGSQSECLFRVAVSTGGCNTL